MALIEGFFIRKGKIKVSKRYRWHIPKRLEGKIEKGDIVSVLIEDGAPLAAVLVIGIIENDDITHKRVIRIVEKVKK